MKKNGIFKKIIESFSNRKDESEEPSNISDTKDSDDKINSEPSSDENDKGDTKDRADSTEEESLPKVEGIKDLFSHVIKPEERTLGNYVNPKFWLEQYNEYKEIRNKEKQDLSIYSILSEGARPTIEYYILTVLSSVIATIGLIQGSTATIIGAMIVAPLMTPILAFSLGVVWGDLKLIKISLISILKGTFWALIISIAIAYIVPIPEYSDEIISRTAPSIFDILVAIASGIVGAYGYANKKISNTIIGIAIAVALMPPLCIIGIGIGTRNFSVASGSAILFIINLISIGLAGAIVFWWMKIHPALADQSEVTKRAMSQILISTLILLAISIPIGFFMYKHYKISEAEKSARSIAASEFPGMTIFKIEKEKSEYGIIIDITLTGGKLPDEDKIEKIKKIKKQFLKKHENIADLKIKFIRSRALF